MMYTVSNTKATSATLPNLQCNAEYTIWVYAEGGQTGRTSVHRMVSLAAIAPPTPTEVTAQFASASIVRVAWRWTSSGPAPSCFDTTTVTYHPEVGGESSLQLSDPAATESALTDLQCNTSYTITVVATAGEHRTESVGRTVFVPLQGILQHMYLYIIAIWKLSFFNFRYTSPRWSNNRSHCRQHKYQSVMGMVMSGCTHVC